MPLNDLKKSIGLIFFFIFSISYSGERPDTSLKKLNAECAVSLNSNGISTIPAFSLGKPAVVAVIGLKKGRFSLDPTLAYGLNFKPWYIDSWLHYRLIDRPDFKLRTGFNFSMYFSDYNLTDAVILQGQRYWALELACIYDFSPKANVTVMYWNDRGQDPGTLIGHFISVAGEKSGIKAGRYVSLSASLQVFYIDYDGNNDGLFVTPKLSAFSGKIPFSLFVMATQPIMSNISPYPDFNWNIGLLYTF